MLSLLTIFSPLFVLYFNDFLTDIFVVPPGSEQPPAEPVRSAYVRQVREARRAPASHEGSWRPGARLLAVRYRARHSRGIHEYPGAQVSEAGWPDARHREVGCYIHVITDDDTEAGWPDARHR